MILAHGFPIGTTDIDATPRGIEIQELDLLVKQIAIELKLPNDWLNPYFASFVHTLPADYGSRLKRVFSEKNLQVDALGAEDMLVMKCFAHRQKDVGHAKQLIKRGAKIEFVENHLESLKEKKIPGVEKAQDFLDDVMDQVAAP